MKPPALYDAEARVVYEHHSEFHPEHGPHERGKVGVAYGNEVFWTGAFIFPGTDMETYGARVGFATELARRWNAGRAALQEGKE